MVTAAPYGLGQSGRGAERTGVVATSVASLTAQERKYTRIATGHGSRAIG